MNKFIETKGILRICSIPHIASSSDISIHIIFKLLKHSSFMGNVLNFYYIQMAVNDIDTSSLIMRYVFNHYPTSQDYHGVACIIYSFQYKNFYEIFLKEGGIIKIYSTLRETKGFRSLKSPETNTKDQIKEIYHANKILVKYSIRLLLIHIIKQIHIYILKNISHSLPPINVYNIFIYTKVIDFNYKHVDQIIKLIQKNGIIRYKIEFYESDPGHKNFIPCNFI
ncbi:hypothetical protein HZS_7014 [Henneguya salminicola]|nr:hypothetical protein HZS_7014 [Henneguya salminicola]